MGTFWEENSQLLEKYTNLQILTKETGENDPDKQQQQVYMGFVKTIGLKLKWIHNFRQYLEVKMKPLQKNENENQNLNLNLSQNYSEKIDDAKKSAKISNDIRIDDFEKRNENLKRKIEEFNINFKGGLY